MPQLKNSSSSAATDAMRASSSSIAPAAGAISFETAARASELLSYKHCEEELRAAARGTACEGLEVRGNLEKLLAEREVAQAHGLPLVQHFLVALALAASRAREGGGRAGGRIFGSAAVRKKIIPALPQEGFGDSLLSFKFNLT